MQRSDTIFGGALLKKSHAKKARPLNKKKALQVSFASRLSDRGPHFLHQQRLLQNYLLKIGRKFGVKIYESRWTHSSLCLLLRFKSRSALIAFFRTLSGVLARKFLSSERGRPSSESGNFWIQRPFSKVVSWGPEFQSIKKQISRLASIPGFLEPRLWKLPFHKVREKVLEIYLIPQQATY